MDVFVVLQLIFILRRRFHLKKSLKSILYTLVSSGLVSHHPHSNFYCFHITCLSDFHPSHNFQQENCQYCYSDPLQVDYYKQVEHLVKKGFDFKPVIRNICVYLITLTKEISKQTKKGNFIEDSQFYLFETTKKHLTKKQKSCAERLEQETVEVANVHNVPVEIGSLQICRDRVVNDFGKF